MARSPKKLVVLSCGCPDLARLVEHNLGDPAGMAEVEADLRLEMDGIVREGIQCCVLGCTHYPLVADSIRRLYPGLPLICLLYTSGNPGRPSTWRQRRPGCGHPGHRHGKTDVYKRQVQVVVVGGLVSDVVSHILLLAVSGGVAGGVPQADELLVPLGDVHLEAGGLLDGEDVYKRQGPWRRPVWPP